ncbi:benzoate/H(+) symporter BenE family transporter [Vibrio sp. PP-XX7]
MSGVVCGLCYISIGVFGAGVIKVLFSLPDYILSILGGLALLPSIGSGLKQSFTTNVENIDSALITLLASASGISVFGIGSAFWGLFLGLIVKIVLSSNNMLIIKNWKEKYEN